MSDRLVIHPGFVALICASAYFGSAALLGTFLLAACLHELGHAAAAWAMGLHLRRLVLSAQGAELELKEKNTSFGQDLLLCVAGPGANLIAAAVCAAAQCKPLFLGANLLLGCFNLLPVRPLDGGNALHALLCCLTGWEWAERISAAVSLTFALALTGVGGAALFARGGKPWLLLLGIWLLAGTLGSGRIEHL